jgi:hypothetical protein
MHLSIFVKKDMLDNVIGNLSYPGSEKVKPKSPYVCPGCSNHTYDQQLR